MPRRALKKGDEGVLFGFWRLVLFFGRRGHGVLVRRKGSLRARERGSIFLPRWEEGRPTEGAKL